jgi:hypothetical protein
MTEAKYDPNTGKLIAGKEGQEAGDKTDYKALYETEHAKVEELSDVTKHKAYTQLQKDLQKKDELLVATKTQLEELTKQFDPLKSNYDSLTTEHKTLKETLEELELAKDELSVKASRASIIMSKYPELAAFEAEGLLPETGTDDDPAKIGEIFGKFAAKITGIQQITAEGTKKDVLSGGLPKGAGGGGNEDVKGVSAAAELKAANDAVLAGKMKEYNEHYTKYLELSKAKT